MWEVLLEDAIKVVKNYNWSSETIHSKVRVVSTVEVMKNKYIVLGLDKINTSHHW